MKEDKEDFQWEEQEGYADPVAVEHFEERKDDEIRRRLMSRFGFEADELKSLFPDRTALRDFYAETKRLKKIKVEDDDSEEVPVDDYQLSKEDKKEIQERLKKRKEAKEKREKALEKQGDEMLKGLGTEPEVTPEDELPTMTITENPTETPIKKMPKNLKDLLSGDDDDDLLQKV